MGRVQRGLMMSRLPLLSLLFSFLLPWPDAQACTGYECLKEYVDLEDGAYSWADTHHRLRVEPAASGRGGWTGYFLNFTSQQWLNSQLVSRSLWWHTLVVIVPDNLTTTDTTIVWMTDGENKDDFEPDLSDYNMLVAGEIAAANGLVAAALFQIPNQPMCMQKILIKVDEVKTPALPSHGGRWLQSLQRTPHTSCSCQWPRRE